MAEPMKQTLLVKSRVHRRFSAQPVTYGVPWPEGGVKHVSELSLRDEGGRALPAGFTVLNTWPDGSVQWSLVDLALDFEPSGTRTVTIEKGQGAAPQPAHPVRARVEDASASVGNGLVEIVVSAVAGGLVSSWTVSGRPLVVKDGFDITFADARGRRFSAAAGPRSVRVEHLNAMRGVLRVDGKHAAADGSVMLDYFLRLEVRADRPDIKLTYSFRNPELPVPGIEVRSLYMAVRTSVPAHARRCFTANNWSRHYLSMPLRVDEDPDIVASDTGDLENYEEAHKEGQRADCFVRNPEVLHDPPEDKPWFLRDQRFRLQAGGAKCVWPYLALVGEGGGLVAAFAQMTSLYPKSLTVKGSALSFGIWPDWAGPLKITQGAGRSQTFFLGPVAAGASDVDIQTQYLSWDLGGVHTHTPAMSPIAITPDVEHVRRCKVFAIDRLPPYDPKGHLLFERKVLDAWMGVTYGQLGATDQLQPPPGHGFWNFGDTGANNEEMHALPYFQNHLRSGLWTCAEVGLACATHIMEVDHVAFSVDHFQNGGMVSHCLHHNDGAAYPSHMWFTELLFAYALTGDEEYKKAALRTCENLLHWINTDEGFQIVSADEREAGQPMINLTWCYQFNRDPRYLEACRRIIRDFCMAGAKKYGRMSSAKPHTAPVEIVSYGDYASWEGMYWYWEITRDEEVRRFLLQQLAWRLTPERMGVHGFHRVTDYNPAAYAYYMTGDEGWVKRVARPFRGAFRSARWPLGWVHSMYYIKLAFELGIVGDDDITPQ